VKPHPGELSRVELVAAIALLKPKARLAPSEEALAASTARRLETMAANRAETARVEAERRAAAFAVAEGEGLRPPTRCHLRTTNCW
jgi:hypothetical protein